MRLLVTGGCGFLGSNLAAHAIEIGIEPVIIDNLSRPGSADNLDWLKAQGSLKHIHCDIRNANDVSRAIADVRPTMIFHLAGQVAMTTSISDPRKDFEINALGTLNVLEAVRNYSPHAGIVYSSTNKVYGDLEQFTYLETPSRFECVDMPHGFDESVGLDFHSPYGCSKGAADQYLLDYHRIHNLQTVVFRHSSMYGGRQFATTDQGWVGWFCKMAAQTKAGVLPEPFTISGTGKQVRDVLHARDMVDLYFSAAARISSAAGQAFNIGGGIQNSLSVLELLDFLGERVGVPLAFNRLAARISDQRFFVANTQKASKYFDWSPKVEARAGVASMLDWVETTL